MFATRFCSSTGVGRNGFIRIPVSKTDNSRRGSSGKGRVLHVNKKRHDIEC